MPDWLAISVGLCTGLAVVGCALAWAMRPRRLGRPSRLAAPSDPGHPYEVPDVPPDDGIP